MLAYGLKKESKHTALKGNIRVYVHMAPADQEWIPSTYMMAHNQP